MKVAVCVAAGTMSHTVFGMDLAAAVGWHCLHTAIVPELHYRMGTLLPEQRQDLCQRAVEAGAEFVIFIDSDQRFPNDVFKRLVEHDLDFVGTVISTRRLPLSTNTSDHEGNPLIPHPDSSGIEEVLTTGFGVACIKAEVFQQIAHPWFQIPFLVEANRFVGEDQYFCSRLMDAGISRYIDWDLSRQVRHCGSYEYGLDDVEASWGVAEPLIVGID